MIDWDIWDLLLFVMFLVAIIGHLYRLYLIKSKQGYSESRGFISNHLTRAHLYVESGLWIVLLILIMLKKYLMINNTYKLYEKIYDRWYLMTVLLLLFNYFVVSQYIKKYKVSK